MVKVYHGVIRGQAGGVWEIEIDSFPPKLFFNFSLFFVIDGLGPWVGGGGWGGGGGGGGGGLDHMQDMIGSFGCGLKS